MKRVLIAVLAVGLVAGVFTLGITGHAQEWFGSKKKAVQVSAYDFQSNQWDWRFGYDAPNRDMFWKVWDSWHQQWSDQCKKWYGNSEEKINWAGVFVTGVDQIKKDGFEFWKVFFKIDDGFGSFADYGKNFFYASIDWEIFSKFFWVKGWENPVVAVAINEKGFLIDARKVGEAFIDIDIDDFIDRDWAWHFGGLDYPNIDVFNKVKDFWYSKWQSWFSDYAKKGYWGLAKIAKWDRVQMDDGFIYYKVYITPIDKVDFADYKRNFIYIPNFLFPSFIETLTYVKGMKSPMGLVWIDINGYYLGSYRFGAKFSAMN